MVSKSPVIDDDGVLVEPVKHTDLEVDGLPLHPDRHVYGTPQGLDADL